VPQQTDEGPVLVIGLGRFGSAVAQTLVHLEVEVLGIDNDAHLVQRWADALTHTVQADSTDEAVLRQLGAPDFTRAVVAIGSNVEASILTTSLLHDLGVEDIWAKALTTEHGRILERVGATHVVFPEREMGTRVAHLVHGHRMLDYIEFDDGFAVSKTSAPVEAYHHTLGESELRRKYDVTVVGIKRPGEDFTYATADTVVHPGDVLVVSGKITKIEAFARLP